MRERVLLAVLAIALLLSFTGTLFVSLTHAYADEPKTMQTKVFQGAQGQSMQEEAVAGTTDSSGYDEQDSIDARTNQSHANIPDSEVPLASFLDREQATGAGHGSFFNALAAAFSGVSMLLMLLALSMRKTSDYRVIAVRTIAVAFGLVTIVAWSLLDRLQVSSLVFNEFSAVISVLLSIYVAFAIFSYVYEARLNKVSKR